MAVPCPRSLFSSPSTDNFSDRKRISLSNLSLGAEIGGARDRRNLIVPSTEAWDPVGRASSSWDGFERRGLIWGHRGSTFVVVISGEIVASPYLESLLQFCEQMGQIASFAACYAVICKLSSIGGSEVSTYEVATACLLAVEADKLICIADGQIHDEQGRLARFMSVEDADLLIRKRAKQSEIAAKYVSKLRVKKMIVVQAILRQTGAVLLGMGMVSYNATFQNDVGFDSLNGLCSGGQGFAIGGEYTLSRSNGYLSELAAAAFVCRGGVQRVHILDATLCGALLLELLTGDGVGTMVASDVYGGTLMGRLEDIPGIKHVIRPLEESGALIRRSNEQLLKALDSFIVVDRDGSIIARAALFPFFEEKCRELAAITSECRGHGQGDKLLDFIEKKASSLGLEKLFLLTTRAADWFVRRGFSECSIESIPQEEGRKRKINLSCMSKYHMKRLQLAKGGVTMNQIAVDN